jgi:hypothetical protein
VYRYFDVLDVAGLKSKAVALNNSFFLQKMQQLPLHYSIDYVHAQGDLSVVSGQEVRPGAVLALPGEQPVLTHSLTHSLTHPLTHLLTRRSTQSTSSSTCNKCRHCCSPADASTSSSPTSARPSTTSAHSPLSLMCYSLTYKTLQYTHYTM